MISALNETHDPSIESWVESANKTETDFPLQNLPFGIARRRGSREAPRVCVAIGDFALDIAGAHKDQLLSELPAQLVQACDTWSLNRLMMLGQQQWSVLRRELHSLLRADVTSA